MAALGVSKSTVQRVWAQLRLKPHQLDPYMASNDPQSEEKATTSSASTFIRRNMLRLFCVDEKTDIQALVPS